MPDDANTVVPWKVAAVGVSLKGNHSRGCESGTLLIIC